MARVTLHRYVQILSPLYHKVLDIIVNCSNPVGVFLPGSRVKRFQCEVLIPLRHRDGSSPSATVSGLAGKLFSID